MSVICGIAGIVDFHRDLREDKSIVRLMTQSLRRRGPDAEGYWSANHVLLGHRRLAIIDLEDSQQPMVVDIGGIPLAAVSFCGEIYNFRELRVELMTRGHVFRTLGDTEVLLRAYLEWGTDCVSRLDGMFAFAIWDVRAETLTLFRDRFGIKPLYFFLTSSGILFGSEPKAILAHPIVRPRVDADGLREILDMVKTPGRTPFAGMYEVRPGYFFSISRSAHREIRYWNLPARRHQDDYSTTVDTVRQLLTSSVERQLVADVPRSCLLSGGVDSSTVTALAAKALPRGELRTYSMDFKRNMDRFERDAVRSSSDAIFARELANYVGTSHREILLTSEDLLEDGVRQAVLDATDLPPVYWGDMWPSLLLMFREVRKESTVAFSGEAADELFGGYRWFFNPAALSADTFPWLTSGSARYFGGSSLLQGELINNLEIKHHRQDQYFNALSEMSTLDDDDKLNARMREISYLNLTRFLQTLLDRNDRMSMATGLEVRVPFCDHALVEYVYNVPWEMKIADGRAKSLLRAAVGHLLPSSVLAREKTPYPATQDPAYEAGLQRELGAILADGSSPVLELLNPEQATRARDREPKSVSQPYERGSIELVIWLNRWLEQYKVEIAL